MEITGTIVNILPAEQGVSKSGKQWTRQTVVITYDNQYPKELALTLMNDKCDTYSPYLAPGQQLKFHFDIVSREFNGRYYTECMIWKIERPQAQPQQAYQAPAPQPAAAPMPNYAPQPMAPQPTTTHYQQPPSSPNGLPF